METKSTPVTSPPPRLFSAITNGFNTVANHIYLVVFPIVLDLLLWFGPHIRVQTLMQPFWKDLADTFNQLPAGDTRDMLQTFQATYKVLVEHYNLLSSLRSFPIGIPSLMSGTSPLHTPLGNAPLFESPSMAGAVATWLLFGLVGLLFGSYYFHLMGQLSIGKPFDLHLGQLGWETLQSLLLVILLVIVLIIIAVPVMTLVSILGIISPGLAQFAFLLITIFLLWLLVPLAFSPHGIFTFQLDALRSTMLSYRLVRFFLPGTGLFLLVSLLISQGMDVLWRVPPETSWMVLIGILGHAFISTGLVTASFIYYTGGVKFMQETLQQRERAQGVRI